MNERMITSPGYGTGNYLEYYTTDKVNVTDSDVISNSNEKDIARMINIISRPIIVVLGTIGNKICFSFIFLSTISQNVQLNRFDITCSQSRRWDSQLRENDNLPNLLDPRLP